MTSSALVPDFIGFLFSNKPKFDSYFKVGNASHGEPERIGAVKLMLMAHSQVFRAELEYSGLKEKEEVAIKDIHPDTFRGMLKYVYGHDTTHEMVFDEADNMLYAAEKYMMKPLKDKLALRLMQLLNYDNICSLLNNPACHTHLELNSAITDILRYETDRVLASPQFLWMNADGFVRILEQDALAATELELWRAAITWAKHRANSEDGQQLRQQLPPSLTRQIRLCSLSVTEFCEEVATTDVLTKEEIGTVCQSIVKKEKPRNLSYFSNDTKPRKVLKQKMIVKGELSLALPINSGNLDYYNIHYNFFLRTKESHIELLPLVCQSGGSAEPRCKVSCTTIITKPYSFYEPPVTVTFSEDVERGAEFLIPLAIDGRNIKLLPDTLYRVTMVLFGRHRVHHSDDRDGHHAENDHLRLSILKYGTWYPAFPSAKLQYNVVTTAE